MITYNLLDVKVADDKDCTKSMTYRFGSDLTSQISEEKTFTSEKSFQAYISTLEKKELELTKPKTE